MNTTLLTALAALVPASMLFTGSAALPAMRWGAKHSAGHYVDLGSAIAAVTLGAAQSRGTGGASSRPDQVPGLPGGVDASARQTRSRPSCFAR